MEKQEILERGRKIKAALEQQGGYWAFAPDQAMQIGPEPFVISSSDFTAALEAGQTVFRFWQEALRVQLASIRGDLPAWVAESVEGPLDKAQREWQRKVCLESGESALPYLARLDCTSLWYPVEIQERLGFLGGCASWHMANDEAGYPDGISPLGGGNIPLALAAAFRNIAGLSCPRVLLVSPKGYLVEQNFLRYQLEVQGILSAVIDRDELLTGVGLAAANGKITVNSQPIDLIYRRELNAATLAQTEAGLEILRSCLAGKVAIEPPLNMLYDCKSPMVWVHHPETAKFFSDDVRALIPPAALLPLSNLERFRLGSSELTINEIFEFSNDKRTFVIKYAGPSIEYGFGGRAVYSLACTHKRAREIIDDARNQIWKGHPWIIQPQDHAKYPTWRLEGDSVVSEEMYARLLFYYSRSDSLFAGQANFNRNWKVAGNKATVFSIICEKGDKKCVDMMKKKCLRRSL